MQPGIGKRRREHPRALDRPVGTTRHALGRRPHHLRGGHTLTLAWEKGRLKAARLKAGSSETLTVDYRGRSLTMKMKKGKTYPPVF